MRSSHARLRRPTRRVSLGIRGGEEPVLELHLVLVEHQEHGHAGATADTLGFLGPQHVAD